MLQHTREIEHVTAKLAVDSATIENGCLEVVPESHKIDAKFLKAGQIHPDWEAAHDWVAVPLEPGMFRISLRNLSNATKFSR
jgi:2-aminoethylphosphonate dioxygenase